MAGAVASPESTRPGPVPGPVGVPQSPPRPRNTLWIIVGLLLMTVAGLAALGLAGGLAARVEVLVAARPIAEGQVVTVDDLAVAEISVSADVQAISPRRIEEYVGRVATGPVGAGAVLHPGQFADAVDDGAEHVIVGAALQPGAYPRVGLRPGDRVRLVDIEVPVASSPAVEAEVVEVVPTGSGGELLISLRIDEAQAEPVSGIAARSALRLALIDEGFDDLVTPLEPVLPVTPLEPADLTGQAPSAESGDAEPVEPEEGFEADADADADAEAAESDAGEVAE
ncbi:MAG: SAF domain-containing protein [Actinomycetota bacterium]